MSTTKFNISFKKQPRSTGLASIGESQRSDIKVNMKCVGMITGPSWRDTDNSFKVRLMVKDGDQENVDWKWITMKVKFENDKAARLWVKQHLESVGTKFPLYSNGS